MGMDKRLACASGAMGAAIALAGCGSSGEAASQSSATDTFKASGSITLRGLPDFGDGEADIGPGSSEDACAGKGKYADLKNRARVTVRGSDGNVLALGSIRSTEWVESGVECRFAWQVKDVPAGQDFYEVQIAKRDPEQRTAAEMRKPWKVRIVTVGPNANA